MQTYIPLVNISKQEEHTLRWLSKCGPLEKAQVIQLLGGDSTGKKRLKRLLTYRMVCLIMDGQYVSLRTRDKPEKESVTAVWVFLNFLKDASMSVALESGIFMVAPTRLLFIKNNHIYQIVVVDPRKLYMIRGMERFQDMRYIFVVPDLDIVEELRLPDDPCLFCTVSDRPAQGRAGPEISFYQ